MRAEILAELLDEGLPHLKAVELFEQVKAGQLKITRILPETLFDVVFEASGSKELADAYQRAAMKARQPPERR